MFLAAFFQTDRSSKLKISFYFPCFFLVSVAPQFIKSLSQVPEEGHRYRAVWTWTSQIPPNPKANVKFVLLVAHLMSDESQMQSSQIGAQTSVLFVSMFQVSGSLTSSLACGWNCPTISFHKKNHREDHITLIITHHTACFFLKDLETQRLRDSDRDIETETETDYFLVILWLLWSSVRVSICFCLKTRLFFCIDRQWQTDDEIR